jgi:signal transduction histidine kinase/CheY-like chemotaxis protein/HAMP domain-containing protein
MRVSFRSKLLILVGTAAAALVTLVLASGVLSQRVERHIENIRRQYLPRVGLRPELSAQFERMQRGFQDAVAANDKDKLAGTAELKRQFLQKLAAASEAIDPQLAAALAQAVEDFHARGLVVSGRLIAGETGESVVAQMSEMQEKRARVVDLLDKATVFNPAELTSAFNAASDAQRTASSVRVAISGICVVLVFLLFLWISRDVLGSLSHLTEGFRRFGEGNFATAIPVVSKDELGDLARQANQMAQSLQRLEAERSRVDWLKGAQTGLLEELRADLEPGEAANRAVSFLCRYLQCPVGVIYFAEAGGSFAPQGAYALPYGQAPAFRPGEGLAGQAALQTDVMVVHSEGDQLRIRSGLTEGSPRAIVLVPLLRDGKVSGLLELASLQPWNDRSTELLLSVRETLAVSLEVKRSRRRLEQQAEELLRASAYKSQFLANMSHELRTPLNGILGFAELLHDEEVGPLEPQQKEFLGDVLRSGRHLLQLINDVLDLSKIEAGKLEFRPERIDAEKIVSEVLAILRTAAATKRAQVSSHVDPELGELIIDPARLKQVLYNYLSNALKFTNEGGAVSVRLTAEGEDQFRMEVQDSGKGIAPEDLSRLFVEFQQIQDGSSKPHAGTGLGLALTKRLVEAQGGRVGVRSKVGAGSTFFAVLPRKSSIAGAPLLPAPAPAPIAGKGPSILVVEDDAGDRKTLVEILSGAGYAVQTASTGAEALELAKSRSFDAITLDIFLPDVNGLELLERIRNEGLNKNVQAVVVTVVAERGAVAGFSVQDVLPKPIDPKALVAALKRSGVPLHLPGGILVIDDDPTSLKLVSTTLRQLGYQTRLEQDGAAALRAIRESVPAAVILDLMMPGMNGFEFLEQLRREPAGRNVPVIVWTVKDLTPEEQTFLRSSAQAIVGKGQGGSSVLAELEAVVRKQLAV